MSTQLLTSREGPLLTLTISDPATRNTLSPELYLAAIEALNMADGDAAIRAVILRGDGAHFCAGGHLGRIEAAREALPQAQHDAIQGFHALIEALRAFPKPVIAAVEGHAAGGGMSLALACDLVVAAEDAHFTLSYGRVGLSPDGGATWHLARQLPRATALHWLWLAEPVPAARLQAMGLVNELAPSGQAWGQAVALGRRLAQMAPNALASAKELVNRGINRSLTEQLQAESAAFVDNLLHANAGEGLRAFRARQPPQFE
jgi:enoyl-CoA hydratase/carnithine racemase